MTSMIMNDGHNYYSVSQQISYVELPDNTLHSYKGGSYKVVWPTRNRKLGEFP